MKIFNKVEGWGEKVNFVDDNNILLGYDMYQSCCEHFGWFIADEVTNIIEPEQDSGIKDLPGWNFDTTFFLEEGPKNKYDEGSTVVFRIVNGNQEKFIHLFNIHNGYYSHGFSFGKGENKIQEGSI